MPSAITLDSYSESHQPICATKPLAAGVWTQNIGRAHRMAKALKAGTIWVNTYRAVSYLVPFGGMKHSGIGRENGIDAVKEYLEVKSVWINTSDEAPGNPFVMRRSMVFCRRLTDDQGDKMLRGARMAGSTGRAAAY
jgi:hypothetical protein